MRFAVFLLCVCALVGVANQAAAQSPSSTTVTDERVWFVLGLQSRTDRPGPWRWAVENILRTRDGVNVIDVAGIRPIVNYVIDKHSTVGGGYAFVVNSPETIALHEHRVFQQYIFTSKIATGTLTVRERLEERFIEKNSGMAGRLRSQVRYSLPIKPGSKFSLIGYDELFVHLNDTTVTRQGVDQNRIFGGFGQVINPMFRYEVGYLNQYYPGHNIVPPRMNHVLSGAFGISF